MIANNLIACSSLSSTRINEFNFSCQYDTSVIIPKCVSLSKATITNTLNTFRPSQLTIYLKTSAFPSPQGYNIPNSYYDTITSFLSALNSISQLTTIGVSFTYNTELEVLQISQTGANPLHYMLAIIIKIVMFVGDWVSI